MNLRFLTPLGAAGILMPLYAKASVFSAIVPQTGACTCPGVGGVATAPSWGCILLFVQNAINVAVGLGIVVIVLAIAYAGFVFMTQGASPHARQQGRNVVVNSVIGLLIILGAWLGVDFVMKSVYNPDAVYSGSLKLGPWNSILASNGHDLCLEQTFPEPLISGTIGIITSVPAGSSSSFPNTGRGACSPTIVQNAAAQGGAQMSSSEAGLISCFAGPESRCGATMQNYNWNGVHGGTPSTAYGPFQITLKGNSRCFDNLACSQAAGVSGNLNCSQAFTSSGMAIPGAALQHCQTAAANLVCSAVAADCVYRSQGVRAWSGNRDSTAAHQACVARYGQ